MIQINHGRQVQTPIAQKRQHRPLGLQHGDFVGDGGQFLRRDLEVPFVVVLKGGVSADVSSRIGGRGGAIEMEFLVMEHLNFSFLIRNF